MTTGEMYEKNCPTAEELKKLTQGAIQGDAYAQCELGWCYWNGYCVEENESKAFEWLSKAASQGLAEAQ